MEVRKLSLTARLGRFLFRYRLVAGLLGFVLVALTGRPGPETLLNGLVLVLPGLLLRFWTAGYIGRESRNPEISATRLVVSGPYRYFRHPLYLGNFALVAGVVVGFHPPVWSALVVLFGYLLIYGLISRAEAEILALACPQTESPGFSLREALAEWQTWLVTAVAFGFAGMKWLIFLRR